ncbi:ferrous iron transport protein A [uncultured Anaeromusa sp.]|jgi:Fe2+ transport system protein FeoA|uniref:FeoA family protein n=1 Tax=uncultured Anaeromusa sp. TaxID=673273 RepID=UPI0029C6960C|nr:ferrous iron transport protein A [uncultured Anaeromusa sp.]
MTKELHLLQPGEKGIVVSVNGGGSIKRRIVDMGMVGGTAIEVCKFAPLGDPMEIKVKGCNLSLRKREAAFICVELENEGASRCTKND